MGRAVQPEDWQDDAGLDGAVNRRARSEAERILDIRRLTLESLPQVGVTMMPIREPNAPWRIVAIVPKQR